MHTLMLSFQNPIKLPYTLQKTCSESLRLRSILLDFWVIQIVVGGSRVTMSSSSCCLILRINIEFTVHLCKNISETQTKVCKCQYLALVQGSNSVHNGQQEIDLHLAMR